MRTLDILVSSKAPDSRDTARLAKGLTQAQLAEAIGVKPTQIANWEQGTRKPKVGALMKIADALGIDWTTLIVE